MNEKLIAIVGPTAVGKTKLSIALAKAFNGEIINADAMQVYRGLDIGTAKITAAEADGIAHHLIDIRNPDEPYTVADFQKDARQVISEISRRGRLPILVGGSGLYIKAALFDYRFGSPGANSEFRNAMARIATEKGADFLYEKLRTVDPEAAERIDAHNTVRVIRALEIYHETGEPASRRQIRAPDESLYRLLSIGLSMERPALYRRINARVEQMIDDGLLHEARRLYDRGMQATQAARAIGYKEFFPYFEGKITLEEAVRRLKQNSRRYAKRQMTWFRRQMAVRWFDVTGAESGPSELEQIASFVARALRAL